MSVQPPERTTPEDASHVKHLLGLLKQISRREPSPALRERLSNLAFQRLKIEPESAPRFRCAGHRSRAWLKPILVTALLPAIGITAMFVARYRQRDSLPVNSAAKVGPLATSLQSGFRTIPGVRPSRLPKPRQPRPVAKQRSSAQRMTIRLPYSNSAIETGTDTTIRVAMSQSELLSLGFPVNATVQDGRVVAELTLGDDGLPRAISLPLPLEVIREKR